MSGPGLVRTFTRATASFRTEVLMLRIEGPPPAVNRTASRSPNSAAPQPIRITRPAGSTCSSLARVGVRFDPALTGCGTATAAGR
jgi:hypothetical protein